MTGFDDDTRATPVAEGAWSAHVAGGWSIGAVPNGGYLVATVLDAIGTDGHPDPLSVTAHFLRPAVPDAPATVTAAAERVGRTVATWRAGLEQEGRGRVAVLAATGRLDGTDDTDAVLGVEPPPMPPPDECVERSAAAQGVDLPLLDRLDIRLHPDDVDADPGRPATVRGWIRFRDGRAADPRALLLFADTFPPALTARFGSTGWVPTIELTVHVRRRPVGEWIRARFSCDDLASSGRMVESGDLWDESGRLVARSRQLGLYRPSG